MFDLESDPRDGSAASYLNPLANRIRLVVGGKKDCSVA